VEKNLSANAKTETNYELFPNVREILPSQLTIPTKDGKASPKIIGEGSFGTVELMFYRSMPVAVKHYSKDRKGAACMEAYYITQATTYIQHPSLPYLIGICSKGSMNAVITSFVGNDLKTVTFSHAIADGLFSDCGWVNRLLEVALAIKQIHVKNILHNDIKCDNILLDYNNAKWRSVLIDFGNACKKNQALQLKKLLVLELDLRVQRKARQPHVALEVLYGIEAFSEESDIYSLGMVIKKLALHTNLDTLLQLSNLCTDLKECRPTIATVIDKLKEISKQCLT
jgi:serine/threonine protein kinase